MKLFFSLLSLFYIRIIFLVCKQEGRTAYHYTAMCKDPVAVQKMLRNAGAEPSVLDNFQHSVKYYMDHKQELELPSGQKSTTILRKSSAMKEGRY